MLFFHGGKLGSVFCRRHSPASASYRETQPHQNVPTAQYGGTACALWAGLEACCRQTHKMQPNLQELLFARQAVMSYALLCRSRARGMATSC